MQHMIDRMLIINVQKGAANKLHANIFPLTLSCPEPILAALSMSNTSRMGCQSMSGLHIYVTQPRLKTEELLLMFHLLCWVMVNRPLVLKYMTT